MGDETEDLVRRLRGRLGEPTPEETVALEARSERARPELEALVERIAEGPDPYQPAHDLYRKAMTATAPVGENGERATALWLVWAAFDDIAERATARTPQLEAAMREAAREWLEIREANAAAWRAYADRWTATVRAFSS